MTVDSQNSLAGSGDPALTEDMVADYLRNHPAFFKQHEELLTQLNIPHETGNAVSLLERQVELLRERNKDLRKRIDNFIANAEENDALFEKTRSIVLAVVRATSVERLSATIRDRLKKDFAAASSLLFFATDHPEQAADEARDNEGEAPLNLLPLEQTRRVLGDLFERKRAYCGRLTPDQAELFFPEQPAEIVSAAVVPIHLHDREGGRGEKAEQAPGIPLLVIGSDKDNHFNSKLDTLFLDFIGEVLAEHILQLLPHKA